MVENLLCKEALLLTLIKPVLLRADLFNLSSGGLRGTGPGAGDGTLPLNLFKSLEMPESREMAKS